LCLILLVNIQYIIAAKENKAKAGAPQQNVTKSENEEPQKVKEELKKEYESVEAEQKYLACIVIQQVYYKNDYINIANMMYPLAHLNHNQLFDKVLYENLEHCLEKITTQDKDFVLQNLNEEEQLQTKVSDYILPQNIISKKLGDLSLSKPQNQIKKYIQRQLETELKTLKNGQKLIEQRLEELGGQPGMEKSEKRSKYSNERSAKIYKALLWTAVTIGICIVFSIAKSVYDKRNRTVKTEEETMRKKQKQEYALKKKEEKAHQIQQIKAKKEEEKRSKKGGKVFHKNVTVSENDQNANNEQSDDENVGLKQVFEALQKKKEQNKIISVGGSTQKKSNKGKENKQQQPQLQVQPQTKSTVTKNTGKQQQKEEKAQPKVEESKTQAATSTATPKETVVWTVIETTKQKKKHQGKDGSKRKRGNNADENAPLNEDEENSPSKVVQKPVEEWTTIEEKKKKKN